VTSAEIRDKARELGFDLCGVARADTFPELGFLREWLDRGYAGDMAYMSRSADRRADVRAVVPGARSVIVTGTLYNTVPPYTPEDPTSDRARIARYAWGDDYHDVLEARLDALLEWMRARSEAPFDARAYVDTGPVQERVYAQYAGLGWIGKNTCLIHADKGSWLFLAEIICTLPLDVDTPGVDQCGSCTRCLDACPTEALVARLGRRGLAAACRTRLAGARRALAAAGCRPARAGAGHADDAREGHGPAAQPRRGDR